VPLRELARLLDPAVFLEVDAYWAQAAGEDPAVLVRDLGARAALLHVKDGPAVKGEALDRQVPAGEGTLDWPAIAAAGRSAVEWLVVEFDEHAGDLFAALGRSLAYLERAGLRQGR
jgi:sugar phosphate isomerase/epimerase